MWWARAWGKHRNAEELLKGTWCGVQLARDGGEGLAVSAVPWREI